MAEVSYHRLLTECRQQDNSREMFLGALQDVGGKVDFSRIKSCVAFGTADGGFELEFVRRLLPNLRAFTAVEPDPESATALRAHFHDGRLAGVETSVVETTIESWDGGGRRHDAVLLFSVLHFVHSEDRKIFFRKLMTRYLRDGGMVVIFDNVTSIPSGYLLVLKRFGTSRVDYDELEAEMLEAGFRVASKQDVEQRCEYSDPSDGVVKFIQLMVGQEIAESEVRRAIVEIFSQPNMDIYVQKLAIFTK